LDVVAELMKFLDELAKLGYRKIVLAGHSWGATLALYTAAKSDQVSAVIATSPGLAVDDPPTKEDTARGLSVVGLSLRGMAGRRLRVSITLLDDDAFNPNPQDRIILARSLLRLEGIPSLLIHPLDRRFKGHFASEGFDFALEYSGCLRDFIEASAVKPELR
jgi:pimeloyl-ACP methyl ester carboxylesterase